MKNSDRRLTGGQRLCGAQKEKLESINEAIEAFSKRLDWQDKQIGEDLVNLNVTNTSQRTTVLEIQEKMDSMYKAFETLPKRLDSLDVNIGRKLDLVNVHIKNASQRTIALEMQDNQDSMFKVIEALSKHFDSLDTNMERKLDLVNMNVMNMSERTTALEMKDIQDSMFKAIVALSKRLDSLGTNMERKLDLVNVNVMNMSERTTALEMKGRLALINKTIKAWYTSPHSFNKSVVRKLDVVIKSIEELSLQFKNTSETIKALAMPVAGYALQFPQRGTSDYVIVTRGMPNLSAVTVCLWMKTADTRNEGALLSYAVSGENNELLLTDSRLFRIYINDHGSGYTSVSANDGKWHHICLTWEKTTGSWKLFQDGSVAARGKSLQTGHMIRANGSLVLGQEQDSKGGKFEAHQSFIGEMTGVNIWDHVIKDQEIARMSKSCLTGVGNVFQWREFKAHIKGSVKIIEPSC
ncbi:neuronal pentraxin-1-like isoform X2 [Pocillopora verrucosa]|uniref:neuronal pentraxin-1-like isoform X2 n=1 Tax=Pocillopora verrucosa TaxID=203993 RepID=UPI00333FBD08